MIARTRMPWRIDSLMGHRALDAVNAPVYFSARAEESKRYYWRQAARGRLRRHARIMKRLTR